MLLLLALLAMIGNTIVGAFVDSQFVLYLAFVPVDLFGETKR
jgi:hypothetical protein